MFKPLDINENEENKAVEPTDVEQVKCLIIGSGPASPKSEIQLNQKSSNIPRTFGGVSMAKVEKTISLTTLLRFGVTTIDNLISTKLDTCNNAL